MYSFLLVAAKCAGYHKSQKQKGNLYYLPSSLLFLIFKSLLCLAKGGNFVTKMTRLYPHC